MRTSARDVTVYGGKGASELLVVSDRQLRATKSFKIWFPIAFAALFLTLLAIGTIKSTRLYIQSVIDNTCRQFVSQFTAINERVKAIDGRVSSVEKGNESLREDMERLKKIILTPPKRFTSLRDHDHVENISPDPKQTAEGISTADTNISDIPEETTKSPVENDQAGTGTPEEQLTKILQQSQ